MKLSIITTSIRPEGLAIVRESLLAQSFRDFEWLTEINWSGEHDLNASYNRLITRAKGEIIVSIQDYIKIAPDALQRLAEASTEYPDTFFTCPVGKVDNLYFTGTPKWDWRTETDKTDWKMWEIDFGACPREALIKIGGFDEKLDGHWSMDNVNVGLRAELDGYKFKCLKDIRALAYDHDAFMDHPFRANYEPMFCNARMDQFRMGLRVNYLNSVI